MTGHCRVGVESADGRVTNRKIGKANRRIESDAQHRTIWQHDIATGDVYPSGLGLNAGSEIKTDLHVSIICSDNRDA